VLCLLILSYLFFLVGATQSHRRLWRGAKKFRVGVGGVPVSERMQTLAEFRGMAGEVPDRRWGSLGQGGAPRCAAAHRPHAGWMTVLPTMVAGEPAVVSRRRWRRRFRS
jgi:hypothetical protein